MGDRSISSITPREPLFKQSVEGIFACRRKYVRTFWYGHVLVPSKHATTALKTSSACRLILETAVNTRGPHPFGSKGNNTLFTK